MLHQAGVTVDGATAGVRRRHEISVVNDGPVTFRLRVAPKWLAHLSEIKPCGWANHRIHGNQRGEYETLE